MGKKRTKPEENGVHTNGTAVMDPPGEKPPDLPTPEVIPAPQPQVPQGKAEPNRPTKCFSCPVSGGTVEAAVWGKEITIDGRVVTVYSVTISKVWRTELGEWKNSNYLRGSELHVARRLLERCEVFILDLRTDEDPIF
jgi:hypothetical protein